MAKGGKAKKKTNKMRIAVIPGDGIGHEVVPEGIRVLEAAARKFDLGFEFETYDWSCERFHKTGAMMPEDGLEQIRDFGCDLSGCGRVSGRAGPRVAVGAADPDPARFPAVH